MIYFPSGQSTSKIVLPLLAELGVEMKLHIDAQNEQVYLFDEKDIHIVHKILKFQIKGKDISPKSVKTSRRQIKTKKI